MKRKIPKGYTDVVFGIKSSGFVKILSLEDVRKAGAKAGEALKKLK